MLEEVLGILDVLQYGDRNVEGCFVLTTDWL